MPKKSLKSAAKKRGYSIGYGKMGGKKMMMSAKKMMMSKKKMMMSSRKGGKRGK